MALYAISDLHLSLSGDKPMDVFGDKWFQHDDKIKEYWYSNIKPQDTVILAGDLSWSMSMDEGLKELQWVNELPGRKIIVKGNHDYWWNGITRLNRLFSSMFFIQNNFYSYGDLALCGTRGWICPNSSNFNEHDKKIYRREVIRLELSLKAAKNSGFKDFLVAIHYPPMNENFEENELIQLLKSYGVSKVIYGHIHGPFNRPILQGTIDSIDYALTSCDFLDFKPIKLMD